MVITVTCPACAASFPVDPNKIPEAGVKVRCSACANVFRVERPAPELPAPEPAGSDATDAGAEADAESGGTGGEEGGEPSGDSEPADDESLPGWGAQVEEDPATDGGGWGGATETEEARESSDGWTDQELAEPEGEAASEPSGCTAPEPDIELTPEPMGWADAEPEPAPWAETESPERASEPEQALPEPTPVPEPESAEAQVQGFTFGKRDPMDKARRLARVLVSDMVMYNAERHRHALQKGTLAEDFEEEIDKSWKEFVDQVGPEIADGEGRRFWSQALNDILAKGASIF